MNERPPTSIEQCGECPAEVKVYTAAQRHGGGVLCPACRKGHSKPRAATTTRTCENTECGCTYIPRRRNVQPNRFCSRRCYWAWVRDDPTERSTNAMARKMGHALDAYPAEPKPVEPAPQADDAARAELVGLINDLPDRFRDVIMCRAIERMSTAATAERLGCPVNTVISRTARGRAKLKSAGAGDLLARVETSGAR